MKKKPVPPKSKDKPQKVTPKNSFAAKKKKGKTDYQASTRKRIGVKVARNQDLQWDKSRRSLIMRHKIIKCPNPN